MTAKGHCRFNVALDIAEFYEIPEPEYHADEESLRLPSGKLLSHRTKTAGPTVSKKPNQAADHRLEPSATPSTTPKQSSDVVSAQENPTTSSNTQLSRLTRGEQQSLAHLPDNEVRALLAANAKSIDQARRAQTHAQLKVEKAKNVILMSRFRMDTSMRFRGVWG
jgi:pre-60S factor REI1